MYDYETTDAIYQIPLGEIYASDEFNCRDSFTSHSVKNLADTIQEVGRLIEPIIVQPMGDVPDNEQSTDGSIWRVVAGHRRVKAVKILGWETIPARIIEGLTAIEAARFNLLENIERKNLNILEEARHIGKIWDGYTDKDVAKNIKRPLKWVKVRRKLLELPEEIQEAASSGRLSQYDVEFIGGVEPRRYLSVFNQILARKAGKPVSRPRSKTHKYRPSKIRTKSEIDKLMVYIMELSQTLKYDCSSVVSTLAWMNGSITTRELLEKRLPLHFDENILDD